MLAVLENFNFNPIAHLSFLNGFMVLIGHTNRFYGSVLKENVVLGLISRRIFGGSHNFPCRPLLLSTSVLNDTIFSYSYYAVQYNIVHSNAYINLKL